LLILLNIGWQPVDSKEKPPGAGRYCAAIESPNMAQTTTLGETMGRLWDN
jgi:hypothetical protein